MAQTYAVQDLGAASGQISSIGTDLNDLGQACGGSGTNAVLFSGGQVRNGGDNNSDDQQYS
ncbi:MAG TPA: hypothetical protein VGV18_04950 [Verrucomicrobiae bacterium]|nr:hypothetical protein [Verrucomicrobiae bacterium]